MTLSELIALLAEEIAEERDFMAWLAEDIDCSEESEVEVGVGVGVKDDMMEVVEDCKRRRRSRAKEEVKEDGEMRMRGIGERVDEIDSMG